MDERNHLQHHIQENPEVHHETSDINVSFLAKFAIGFVVIAIVIHVVLYFMFAWMESRSRSLDPEPISLVQPGEIRRPPAPNLQRPNTAPAIEIQQMRNREALNLGLTEAAAPQPGRIPIEDAMRLVVERGLPVRPAGLSPSPPSIEDSGIAPAPGISPRLAPGLETGFPTATPRPGRNEAVRPSAVPGPPQVTTTPQPQVEPNR